MLFDIVVQFRVTADDRAKAEAKVRESLEGLPENADVDIVPITPNHQERLLSHLEKTLGVKKERIAKAFAEVK